MLTLCNEKSIVRVGLYMGLLLLGLSSTGCLATRGWVLEQMAPLDNRVTTVEGRVTDMDSRLTRTEARVDDVVDRLDSLRLERRLVLNMKEGATFATGSAALAEETESEIDNFLGGLEKSDDLVFVVAGHTDSVGAEARNYDLGQRRAASVARYLTMRKGVDPLQVTAMSYGESAPVADNSTAVGRRENRRVEILVYRQAITSSPGEKSPHVSQVQ